ncbi:hypothetical protein FDP41_008422 [Naegleria fowleri]|uniref:Protein kinase domain-containing protein n=1 Tax=Naegleria fowleri TaxID=5763 RepID=A0A6A5BGR8_NAEFO|nr:uncharacterized protein FDP41_008422 [Naegleria fowleri]KAF0973215.1 hypothetical protein FDP41_008422 [Naegleria fowleri]
MTTNNSSHHHTQEEEEHLISSSGSSITTHDSNSEVVVVGGSSPPLALSKSLTIPQQPTSPPPPPPHHQQQDPTTTSTNILQTALPPFFTPVQVHPYSSPVIHYDRHSSIILTCKYTPQNNNNMLSSRLASSLDIDSTVYCVKVSLNIGSISQLENDVEISNYLNKEEHFKSTTTTTTTTTTTPSSSTTTPFLLAPKIFAYLSDYFILVREWIHGETFRSWMDHPKMEEELLSSLGQSPLLLSASSLDHPQLSLEEDQMHSIHPSTTTTRTTTTTTTIIQKKIESSSPHSSMLLNPLAMMNFKIPSLITILEMAIEACHVLDQIHSLRVCHCDIRPENFMFDHEHSCVRLIDFGLSCFLPLDHPFIYTDRPKGCYKYMSPEATGKIPKPMGFHSDIYSFGFVLFEMIAKEHPFGNKLKNNDYMYCHVTLVPELLITNLSKRGILQSSFSQQVQSFNSSSQQVQSSLLNQQQSSSSLLNQQQSSQEQSSSSSLLNHVISAISLVIAKMVQKSIEKRYLSMDGVKQDLSFILKCLNLNDSVSLTKFTPGQFDIQTTMKIPYVVYGREDVITNMTCVLNEMIDSQSPKAIFISGHSGIGKSCVVREFRNKAKQDVLYFEAKYDQNHNIPFFAIKTIVSAITESSLGESELFIQEFREQLVSDLSPSQIDMICDAIPTLSLLFFSFQKRPTTLKDHESMKEFSESIIHLLRVYTQMKQKNLCIFLDDLQWADFESLNLLKQVLGLSETFPFLLIGAFRNNEISNNSLHPLNIFIESIKMKNQSITTEIELKELTEQDCNLLVAESVHRTLSDTSNLTFILYSKTKGNPFFLKQLLVTLFQEGKIFFDKSLRQISWNLEEIENVQYTQNVVEFLLLKLENMEPMTKKALAYASCIGYLFVFHELLELFPEEEKHQLKDCAISQAIEEGWISYVDDGKTLKFNHDRLQQAANESLSDQTKSLIHYKFGKFRLGQVENGEILLDDFIFEIVNHLNHRSHDPKLLQNTDKRRYLLNLNKLAAKKAVNTCATEQAQVFVRTAFDLLNMENEISTLYNTAFELLMIQGHVEYANNHVDDAIQIFHSAIHKAMTKHHLFEACYHAITAYLSQSKYEQVYQVLYDHVFTSYEELYFLHDQDSTTNPITTTLTTLHEKVNDDLKSTHTIIMANITHSEYLKHHLDHKMSQMKQQFIQQPLNKNDLLEMIEMKDPESIYLVHLIAQSAPAVYHINKPNAKLEMLLMLLIGTEIVLKKGLCPLAPLILCQVGAMWCLHDFYPPIHVLVEAGVELARNRFKNLHHLASCLLLKEMCYFIFPNINAIEVWNITEEAFLLAIQSNNKSFGGFSILWYPFHHFFYTRSNIKTSIELSKKSMEWYRQVGNYMLLDASQMILEMKRVLSGERETFDPSYCQSQVIEYPFFRQMHYMLKGITCYFQQNYEQAFYCMEKSFEYRQDSACLCSTWIDIVFQGLVACAYQKQLLNQQQPPHQQSPHQPQQQEQQPPQEQQQSTWNTCLLLLEQSSSIQELIQKCQVLIDYSLKMLEQVSQSNPLVFQCSLELIKAEHLHCRSLRYGEENSRSIISGLNKSLKLAIRDRHYLIAKIVNLKIGELYKSLEMDDYISGSYFSKAYDQF